MSRTTSPLEITMQMPTNLSSAYYAVRCLFTLFVSPIVFHSTAAADGRDWTVKDSVELRYVVGDLRGQTVFPMMRVSSPFLVSPDGLHVVFGTRRGDLREDCNRYELRI